MADPDLAPELYVNLMKQCLIRGIFPEGQRTVLSPNFKRRPVAYTLFSAVRPILNTLNLELVRPITSGDYATGTAWPAYAETMIGLARLQNIQDCVTDVLKQGVPGDFIETGVWRGGACIFMRAILKAHGITDRTVWLADSFQGLPKPDGRFEQDAADKHWEFGDILGVSEEQVKANFKRYGLLDDQVKFLVGWFKDTLPTAPIRQIAVLRLDGDMYASTMDALNALYPKVSVGGYVIIDDYGAVPACKKAVDDFRRDHQIAEPMVKVDWSGMFWKRA